MEIRCVYCNTSRFTIVLLRMTYTTVIFCVKCNLKEITCTKKNLKFPIKHYSDQVRSIYVTYTYFRKKYFW